MASDISERRRFTRVFLNLPATLWAGQQPHPVQLIDICLNGALLAPNGERKPEPGRHYRLEVQVAPGAPVDMTLKIAHSTEGLNGFECHHIGLASLSHLQRLLEVHVQDDALIYRELAQLEQLQRISAS